MHKIQFIPECYAETAMVRIIFDLKEPDNPNHQFGISQVCMTLEKKDISNYSNIGFIDNDKKNVPYYFDNFVTIDEHPNVIFKSHPDSNDYLFVVKPAIEKFILAQLYEIKKQPSDYGLPNDFREFRKKLKKERIQFDANYLRLISDLKAANPSGISFLIKSVSDLQK